jgi:hypothetical protein
MWIQRSAGIASAAKANMETSTPSVFFIIGSYLLTLSIETKQKL